MFRDHDESRSRTCCLHVLASQRGRRHALVSCLPHLATDESITFICYKQTQLKGEAYAILDFWFRAGIRAVLKNHTNNYPDDLVSFIASRLRFLLDCCPGPSSFLLGRLRYIFPQPVNSVNALAKSLCHHAVMLISLLLVTDLQVLLVTIILK